MSNLPTSVFRPKNIIGLGESSHGSKNESEWKYDLIVEAIRCKPDIKFICYFEAYEDCFTKLPSGHINSESVLRGWVDSCMSQMYSIWQTKETYNFILEMFKLMVLEKRDVKIVGIDFRNKEHKQSFASTEEMLMVRDTYMFENIKKSYQPDAVHFITAHNAHIGRYNEENHGSIGYFLDQEFKDKYLPVAQHVSGGSIRAKYNNGNYQSVDFTYDSVPGSVTSLADRVFSDQIPYETLVLSTSESILENVDSIQQVGFYWPLERPWVMPFGKQYFDYLALHPKSECTESL